jgi:hypothetical protein
VHYDCHYTKDYVNFFDSKFMITVDSFTSFFTPKKKRTGRRSRPTVLSRNLISCYVNHTIRVKGVRSVNFKMTVWNSECNISFLKNVSLILVLVLLQASTV